jgi:hypothetical protein
VTSSAAKRGITESKRYFSRNPQARQQKPDKSQAVKSSQAGQEQPLFPPINMGGGGSPEGAEVQTCTLFSPLWAFFGYFLARQKVTTSPPQRRLEQQEKTACISQQYRLSSDKSPFHDSCEARKNPRNLSSKVAQNPKVCYNQIDIPFT